MKGVRIWTTRKCCSCILRSAVSSGNGSYYTRTKNHFLSAHMYDSNNRKVSFAMAYAPWSSLYYNYRDRRGVYKESSMEGTIMLETFSERAERDGVLLFDKKNPKNKFKNYYSILRFVDKDGNGNELLNFDGQYNEFKGSTVNGQRVEYPASVKSRVKFGKLYIEKTVDKRDNNVVAANDELKYRIIVKNNSNKDYTDDINVVYFVREAHFARPFSPLLTAKQLTGLGNEIGSNTLVSVS